MRPQRRLEEHTAEPVSLEHFRSERVDARNVEEDNPARQAEVLRALSAPKLLQPQQQSRHSRSIDRLCRPEPPDLTRDPTVLSRRHEAQRANAVRTSLEVRRGEYLVDLGRIAEGERAPDEGPYEWGKARVHEAQRQRARERERVLERQRMRQDLLEKLGRQRQELHHPRCGERKERKNRLASLTSTDSAKTRRKYNTENAIVYATIFRSSSARLRAMAMHALSVSRGLSRGAPA